MTVHGGHILQATIRKALAARGVADVEVGFFKDSRYPDGTPVAAVAAWNEFGTEGGGWGGPIPERPYFRGALSNVRPALSRHIADRVDTKKMVVDDNLAEELGAMVTGAVQKEIVELREPANAPATLALKAPKTNPLIDTGTMRTSVTWKVRRE